MNLPVVRACITFDRAVPAGRPRRFGPGGTNIHILLFAALLLATPARADHAAANAAVQAGDHAAAHRLCIAEAEAGEPRCQSLISELLFHGEGVSQDRRAAYAWMEKAAAQDHLPAVADQGWMLFKGEGVEPDPARGWALMSRAALAGDGWSAFNMANAYYDGAFVEMDRAQALRWYMAAAEAGHAGAAHRAGSMLLDGDGAATDRRRGGDLLRRAAELGDESAESALAEARNGRYQSWALLAGLCVVAGWDWFRVGRDRRRARLARAWPRARGRIVAADLATRTISGGTFYVPAVAYQFEVGEQSFESEQIRFGGYPPATEKQAGETLNRILRHGDDLEVIHHPDDPRVSVLEARSNVQVPFIRGLLLSLAALAWLLLEGAQLWVLP